MVNIIDDLQSRGLIYQISNKAELKKLLQKKEIRLYCGFDPTAGSLHIGNLLPLITLRRFQLAGYRPIVVLGGATGLIGDPSGKNEERKLNSPALVRKWEKNIKKQIGFILDFKKDGNPALLVDNYNWLGKGKIISFLRDIGKYFTVPYMLAKESIKKRLETGISFTEFSYMVLQAYDFLYLFQKYNCQLELGGSDQWGNITAGIDLIRRKTGKEAFGFTVPLVTRADGKKFGKTEQGTIWLDPKRTSPYQFYQFWINVSDKDVINYLKYFTFLSSKKIDYLKKETKKHPEKRLAQKALAKEVTTLVHGSKAALKAEKISQKLFSEKINNLSLEEFKIAFQNLPSITLSNKKTINLIDLLIKANIVSSKRQAREDLNNGIISLNGVVYRDGRKLIKKTDCLNNKYLLLKRGKRKYYLILWK